MDLNTVFHNAVATAFKVFKGLIKSGEYIVAVESKGWSSSGTPTTASLDVIVNGLTQDQLKNTKFYTQMEPTDTVIMVKGKDLAEKGIRVRNSDNFRIDFDTYSTYFEIQGHETDPAQALYLILLREAPEDE